MAVQSNPLQNRVNTTASGKSTGQPGTPFEGGTYDNEFGNPGYQGDTTSAGQDQADRDRLLGGAKEGLGDYSSDAADKRERYYAWANEHGKEGGGDPNAFINPGSADYGGNGGVDFYHDAAALGGTMNDAAQASNQSAMGRALQNMTEDRAGHVENSALSNRAAGTRAQQIAALNLSRDAAMGKAPSEAAFQTQLGMNDIMGQQSGQMGGAHGLAGLNGAQNQGTSLAGASAGNLGMAGGLARSKEIGDAIGMYGTQAGTVRDQDLLRLGMNSQNSMFNAKANDDWKIGNANLLAQHGQLGNTQAGTDLAWMGEQQRGQDKQFQYDQEMAAKEAGADADAVGAAIAKGREDKENRRQMVNGGVSAGLTGIGSAFGGPVGGAAGQAAGSAFGSATKDWDW